MTKALILQYKGQKPQIDKNTFIADNAVISGKVTIAEGVGIWYGAVIRGDVSSIAIGKNSNVQDNCTVHGSRANHALNKSGNKAKDVTIGESVTIGHNAVVHACTLMDNSFVGMQATVLDGAIIEPFGMLAAGAVLGPNKVIKSGELWAGVPAKKMRELSKEEQEYITKGAINYNILAMEYKEEQGK